MYGTNEESYLGIADEQLGAIVQVTDGSGPGGPLCTGVFVTNEWLVTAAHCIQIASPRVVLPAETAEGLELPVVDRVPHPTEDIALFRVEGSEWTLDHFLPMSVATENGLALAVGSVVDLAGYGLNEDGDTRELRFLSEPIVELDNVSFVVDGFGANGACLGDSGGPLLARDRSGPVLVAGVLTSGSPSCVDRDRYVRLDRVSDWVLDVVGTSPRTEGGCGDISEEGRCLYGSALFCDEETLVAERCAGDTACGWDAIRAGFRCVTAGYDPCHGIDSVGACRYGSAEWCIDGALESEPCGCGRTCRIDGRTGGPRCAEPDD